MMPSPEVVLRYEPCVILQRSVVTNTQEAKRSKILLVGVAMSSAEVWDTPNRAPLHARLRGMLLPHCEHPTRAPIRALPVHPHAVSW
jgi:hypothetical protein